MKLGFRFWDNYKTNKHISNLVDYTVAPEETELSICNICLDEIKIGKILNCGHKFHLRCIK